jgi:hypothetical protein
MVRLIILTGLIVLAAAMLTAESPVATCTVPSTPELAIGDGFFVTGVTFVTVLNGGYELRDEERRIYTRSVPPGKRWPAFSGIFPGALMTDTDNVWDDDDQNVGVDAHWGASRVYDYWCEHFDRDGLDGPAGPAMYSTVHWGQPVGAQWRDGATPPYVGFSDGYDEDEDGDLDYYPTTSLDIVAHEFGHGLVQYTSGLSTTGISGALNEAFADIVAVAVDHYAGANPNWQILEQQYAGGFTWEDRTRYLDSPNDGGHPDTYLGDYWPSGSTAGNGVVAGHQFYLLSNGGIGTNDNNDEYDVAGIGINTAAKIWYIAHRDQYLQDGDGFPEARVATEQAAIDLHGSCSTEHIELLNAWHAVGVGDPSVVIRGTIVNTSGNPLAGVTLTIAETGGGTTYATTASDGTYRVALCDGWTGTITPSRAGFTFAPTSRSYNNASGYQNDQDYTGTPPPPCAKCPDPHQSVAPNFTGLMNISPNPFNPTTRIQFAVGESVRPMVSIFNASGQRILRADLGVHSSGLHDWVWNGRDQLGNAVSSGVYFVVFEAGDVVDYRKAVLLK